MRSLFHSTSICLYYVQDSVSIVFRLGERNKSNCTIVLRLIPDDRSIMCEHNVQLVLRLPNVLIYTLPQSLLFHAIHAPMYTLSPFHSILSLSQSPNLGFHTHTHNSIYYSRHISTHCPLSVPPDFLSTPYCLFPNHPTSDSTHTNNSIYYSRHISTHCPLSVPPGFLLSPFQSL